MYYFSFGLLLHLVHAIQLCIIVQWLIFLMISYLQKISYAKRDSDVIAKVKGTYSDKNKLSSKRKEEDDAEALAKKKKKVAAKYANDFSIFVLTVKILLGFQWLGWVFQITQKTLWLNLA